MRCPHCGYHSFDELQACKKCGKPLLARFNKGASREPEIGELFRPEELKKRAEIFSASAKGLTGMSPLRLAEKGKSGETAPEQMRLPSFLLDDPHDTTNNWEGWSSGDPQEPEVQLLLRRSLATFVDLVVLAGLLALFAVVAWQLQAWTQQQWMAHLREDNLTRLTCYLLTVFLPFSYFFLGHYASGQTVGKALFSLKVVGQDGASLSMSQTVLRSTGSVLSLLCLGAGFFAIWRDEEQRGWSDHLAGTRIIDTREEFEDQAIALSVPEETQ